MQIGSNLLSLLIIVSLALVSCSGTPTESFDDQVETLVASTLVAGTSELPDATVTNIPAPLSATPTPVPFGEVYVFTIAQNVNLRTNPGTLFTVSRVMAQDTQLRLLGQVPGGEWLYVMNDEGIMGWVNTNVVMLAYDGPPPPAIEPVDVNIITGKVMTELGTPVSGVGFAVIQGERRTDAVTDSDGVFRAYLPLSLSGAWQVGYVSISCKSNTMDENCNCINNICGAANPESVLVELPQSNELAFIWK